MNNKPQATTAGCHLPEKEGRAFEEAAKTAKSKSEWVRETIVARLEREGFLGPSHKARFLENLPPETEATAALFEELDQFANQLFRKHFTATETRETIAAS